MSDEIRTLSPEEWPLVAGVVAGEFGDAMPLTPMQSTFRAAFDGGGRLAGFYQVEVLHRIFHFYVAPGARGGGLARRLMRDAAHDLPGGFSACVLTNHRALVREALSVGARDLGRVHFMRKDY